MSQVITCAATALAICCSAVAHAGDWSSADTRREAIWLTLHAIDWGQTRTAARHPEKWDETNPLLGTHPSVGEVDRFETALTFVHVGIAYYLPQEWRKWFQRVTITTKAIAVGRNWHYGVAVDF
jgi:hypothetical protein